MTLKIIMVSALGAAWPASGAQAQNARALLDKTLQTYHNLNTYFGRGSVEINMVVGQQRSAMSALSSEFTYKRPNRVAIRLNSRGSNVGVYSDGGRLTVYKEEAQKYSIGPSSPTLNGLLPLMQTRANVSAMLDPLYFLTAPTLPPNLTDLKMQSGAKVNGRDVSVVSGVWQGGPPPGQAQNPFCRPAARWTLYIDKANSLLQKVEARVAAKVNLRSMENGKPKVTAMPGTLVMSYVIIDAAPNPSVDDKVFTFTPPKGATEQKNLEDLLKAGAGAAR